MTDTNGGSGTESNYGAAVALTQLVMQAEPSGPKGGGWNRQAVFRTFRRCVHVINSTRGKADDLAD